MVPFISTFYYWILVVRSLLDLRTTYYLTQYLDLYGSLLFAMFDLYNEKFILVPFIGGDVNL